MTEILLRNAAFLQTGIPQYVVNSKFQSSVITIAGALMLWFALFFMGIIAKRYEQVLHKKTDWQFIILSPTGILIYAVIQAYSLIVVGNLKMTDSETWIAYLFFFLSGVLSLIGSLRFFKVVMPHKGGSK